MSYPLWLVLLQDARVSKGIPICLQIGGVTLLELPQVEVESKVPFIVPAEKRQGLFHGIHFNGVLAPLTL